MDFRLEWYDRCSKLKNPGEYKAERRIFATMCKRDPLFFINAQGWTYDPRHSSMPHRPFITYPFQDNVILRTVRAVGHHDMVYPKSRDQGLTWLCLYVLYWFWQFGNGLTFGLVGRNEDQVDKTDEPDCQMWKLRYFRERLFEWMQPPMHKVHLSMKNLWNACIFNGMSATGNVGRGGRRTAFLFDEASSWETEAGYNALGATQLNTPCRLFPSTPQGADNVFAQQTEVAMKERSPVELVEIHWSEHPIYRKGLYEVLDDGVIECKDPDFDYSNYEFVKEKTNYHGGNFRSPWYDAECERTPIKSLISEELDISFIGSGNPFFDSIKMKELKNKNARAPMAVGGVEFDPESLAPTGFTHDPNGCLKLWTHIDEAGQMVCPGPFVVGCDISMGTGKSQSVGSVFSVPLTEKVAEFVSDRLSPHEFSHAMMALAYWFAAAKLIWEANGPGVTFTQQIIANGYPNFWFRQNVESVEQKKSKLPGWHSSRVTKKLLLLSYARDLYEGNIVTRSTELYSQAAYYQHMGDGSIAHSQSRRQRDPDSEGENHGDVVISEAVGAYAMKQIQEEPTPEPDIPADSVLGRLQEGLDSSQKRRTIRRKGTRKQLNVRELAEAYRDDAG